MSSSLSSSVINIITHLRALRVPVASLISTHLSIINRLRAINTDDSATGKLHRALQGLSDPAPDVAADTLIKEVGKDIVAVEKLRALEMRRDALPERRAERQRKETRHLS
ncbi:hypothetical protein BDQ17DRAFT_1109065 [Cyathus striatus]|nr:hypothetical protein BDQ17DRAFT_1109065 [Cyathus striatus]